MRSSYIKIVMKIRIMPIEEIINSNPIGLQYPVLRLTFVLNGKRGKR